MSGPAYPMKDVWMVPVYGVDMDPGQPVRTLEIDSAGRWWTCVGGEPVREVHPLEVARALANGATSAKGVAHDDRRA